MYSDPYILRPPLQSGKYGLKLEAVLKWRDIYAENTKVVSLISCLKIEALVKWKGLELQGPLYTAKNLRSRGDTYVQCHFSYDMHRNRFISSVHF